MFRLAHISDVHLRPLPQPNLIQLMSKRLIGYLNWKLNRKNAITGDHFDTLIAHMLSQQLDHIVVTGDLVNIALPEEFENALTFLRGLGEPDKVMALFGNHDAYVPGSLDRALKLIGSYASGDKGLVNSAADYPLVRVRGDIALIACNSAEATLPFFATGYFRQKQAEKLAKILEEHAGKCRIISIHHPPIIGATPRYKRLIGSETFQNVISHHGAELILHGHTHLATRNSIPGKLGPVPVICVPAAGLANDTAHHPAGRYNLFSISKEAGKWSIEMDEYGRTADTKSIGQIGSTKLS